MTGKTVLRQAHKSLELAGIYADDGAMYSAYVCAMEAGEMFLRLHVSKTKSLAIAATNTPAKRAGRVKT